MENSQIQVLNNEQIAQVSGGDLELFLDSGAAGGIAGAMGGAAYAGAAGASFGAATGAAVGGAFAAGYIVATYFGAETFGSAVGRSIWETVDSYNKH